MRRLEKGPEPEVLVESKERWTAEYHARLAGHPEAPAVVATRYNHPKIKAAVRRETHDKCAYCERKISHTQPGDIEHILPKSRFPGLVCEWHNMTFACRTCNQCKGDYHDPDAPMVDPYREEPRRFLRAFGPMVDGDDPQGRGMLTVRRCRLNRSDLLEWRAEVVVKLQPLVEMWKGEDEGGRKETLEQELLRFADERAEYTLITRAYLQSHGIQIDPEPEGELVSEGTASSTDAE